MGEPQEPPAFRVDVTPPASCKRAQPCEAKLKVVALNGYKVNAEYPFKFVGDAAPSLAFEGTGTFDKATGTMTVKFRALNHCGDCATFGVTHYDQQWSVQVADAILDGG